MLNPIREELLKRLYFLSCSEWPVYPHELTLREDDERNLGDLHTRSFHRIKALASADPEAATFVRAVYDAVSPSTNFTGVTYYGSSDVMRSARQIARVTYARLRKERDAEWDEVQLDPVGYNQRKYIRERGAVDPFMGEGANVAVGGLTSPTKPRLKIDPFSGAVIEEEYRP